MIITVDSNILLSIFLKDSNYKRASDLLESYSSQDFIINDCIYLELGVFFQNTADLDNGLSTLEIQLCKHTTVDREIVLQAWIRYLKRKKFVCPGCKKSISPVCPKCGESQSFRQRVLTDFIIGGFAVKNSNGILTLDPTYYRNYFSELTILD